MTRRTLLQSLLSLVALPLGWKREEPKAISLVCGPSMTVYCWLSDGTEERTFYVRHGGQWVEVGREIGEGDTVTLHLPRS